MSVHGSTMAAAFTSVGDWTSSSWDDALTFAQTVIAHPPSLRAVELVTLILMASWALFLGTGTAVQRLRIRSGPTPATMKVRLRNGDVRAAWVTDPERFGLGRSTNALLITGDHPKRKVTVRISNRKKQNFTDQDIELTSSAMDALGLSIDDKEATFLIRAIPWYTIRGFFERTIANPDQSTALTWRIFFLSTVTTVVVTHLYYLAG
jgi:hypothetical protein